MAVPKNTNFQHDTQYVFDYVSYHADVILDINQILQGNDEIHPSVLRDLQYIEQSANDLKQLVVRTDRTELEWSSLSHKIRTPINNIKGYAELVIDELSDSFSEIPRAYINIHDIVATASYMLEIVEMAVQVNEVPLSKIQKQKAGSAEKHNILIIDEDSIRRQILSKRLIRDGYRVEAADTLAFANNRLDSIEVHLILFRLTHLTLIDQNRLLQIRENFPDLFVLIIAHSRDIRMMIQCLESGADDYLHSPVNAILLRAKIKSALEKYEFRKQKKQFGEILNQAIEFCADGFALFDPSSKLKIANKRFYEIYSDLASGENVDIDAFCALYNRGETYSKSIIDTMRNSQSSMHQLNDNRWIEISCAPIPDGGIVTIHKDVTQRKQNQDYLENLALTDPLTGLGNRTFLQNCVKEAINSKQDFILLFCDLDNFKPANDQWGHEFGDFVLRTVAQRMKNVFRYSDTIARIGGDEFVIMCKLLTANEAGQKGQKLLQSIKEPYTDGCKTTHINISVGVAIYPIHGTTFEQLLKCADSAMYQAKSKGKGQMQFYA